MAKLVRRAKGLASRITGISTPIGGIEWTPPVDEREVVRRLVVLLEDRRALYVPHAWEMPDHVFESVDTIRRELTNVKGTLPEGSPAVLHISAMRAACRAFMDDLGGKRNHRRVSMQDHHFHEALGKLRALMGVSIKAVCNLYGIEPEKELVTIFPPDKE